MATKFTPGSSVTREIEVTANDKPLRVLVAMDAAGFYTKQLGKHKWWFCTWREATEGSDAYLVEWKPGQHPGNKESQ